MAMSEFQLVRLYQRQLDMEWLLDDVRAAALGRSVPLRRLVSDARGRYSEAAAARFAAIMARKCVASRRGREALEAVEMNGDSLNLDMFADTDDGGDGSNDLEGAVWQGDDRDADAVGDRADDVNDDRAAGNDGGNMESAADASRAAPGMSDTGGRHAAAGDRDEDADSTAGSAHGASAVMAMLADLFYCAIRLTAPAPRPEDSTLRNFLDFAYMPLKPKRYVPTEDNSYAYSTGPDGEEERVPDVDPMAGEREDLAEQWLNETLERGEIDLDDLNAWDDMPMNLVHHYALLRGCKVTYGQAEGGAGAGAAEAQAASGSYYGLAGDDEELQRECDQYLLWCAHFANPEEFCRRYERFRDAWWRLGLPEGLDVDMRRAFDLTLVELGVSPLDDDDRYGRVMALLEDVRDRLDAMTMAAVAPVNATNAAARGDAGTVRPQGPQGGAR